MMTSAGSPTPDPPAGEPIGPASPSSTASLNSSFASSTSTAVNDILTAESMLCWDAAGNDSIFKGEDAASMMCWDEGLLTTAELEAAVAGVGESGIGVMGMVDVDPLGSGVGIEMGLDAGVGILDSFQETFASGVGMEDPLGLGMLETFDPAGVELADIMGLDVVAQAPAVVMPNMLGFAVGPEQGPSPIPDEDKDDDGILDGLDDDDDDDGDVLNSLGMTISPSTSALLETIRSLPANMTVSPSREPLHLPQPIPPETYQDRQPSQSVHTRGLTLSIPKPNPFTPPGDVIEYSEVEDADSSDDYVQPRKMRGSSGRGRGRGRGGRRTSLFKRNHHPYKDDYKSKEYLSPDTISPSDDPTLYLPLPTTSLAASESVLAAAYDEPASAPPQPRRRGPYKRRGSLSAANASTIPRTRRNSHPGDRPTTSTASTTTSAAASTSTMANGSVCRPVPGSERLFERTYSSVSVYELAANGTSVMRRMSDGWINATHLLKVAGFTEKARRTKVLEREIHSGKHEKVQGGYGKYQGTWVPLEKAKSLAEKFECYEVLKEILDR